MATRKRRKVTSSRPKKRRGNITLSAKEKMLILNALAGDLSEESEALKMKILRS